MRLDTGRCLTLSIGWFLLFTSACSASHTGRDAGIETDSGRCASVVTYQRSARVVPSVDPMMPAHELSDEQIAVVCGTIEEYAGAGEVTCGNGESRFFTEEACSLGLIQRRETAPDADCPPRPIGNLIECQVAVIDWCVRSSISLVEATCICESLPSVCRI